MVEAKGKKGKRHPERNNVLTHLNDTSSNKLHNHE